MKPIIIMTDKKLPTERNNITPYVHWFRTAAPYINAHRNGIFIICFDAKIINTLLFSHFIYDITLLHSLGVRIVLIFDLNPMINKTLCNDQNQITYFDSRPIITASLLPHVKHLCGSSRIEIESMFSMGLYNSPMEGADMRIISGNLVIAKPCGIQKGIDLCHSGEIRSIQSQTILNHLENRNIVLIPPIGYSPTGEIFFLQASEVATSIATTLKAEKVIFMMNDENFINLKDKVTNKLTPSQAEKSILQQPLNQQSIDYIQAAIHCCKNGIRRTHLIDSTIDGALLNELFTRDGFGTMITNAPYEETRKANIKDIGGILELIKPLENQGILVRRSREHIEMDINDFFVIKLDGMIIACAALHIFAPSATAEIACLTVHNAYRGNEYGHYLLSHLENEAIKQNIEKIFVLSTTAEHWFRERGFFQSSTEALPIEKKQIYNLQRNSKVFYKCLFPATIPKKNKQQ